MVFNFHHQSCILSRLLARVVRHHLHELLVVQVAVAVLVRLADQALELKWDLVLDLAQSCGYATLKYFNLNLNNLGSVSEVRNWQVFTVLLLHIANGFTIFTSQT